MGKIDIEVRCEASAGYCICTLPSQHIGAHECKCMGSWEWIGGVFRVHKFPLGDASPFAPLLGRFLVQQEINGK